VPVVAPAAIEVVGKIFAAALFDDKVTTIPPVVAGALIVTVPVVDVPPWTVLGVMDTLTKVGGVIVSVAFWVALPIDPVIVEVVEAATTVVVTVNVAELDPAGIETLAGTVATVLLEESVTTSPPVPAGPERSTVPVEFVPPATDVGLRVILCSPAGFTVRVAP
jgi:hypothetical protein